MTAAMRSLDQILAEPQQRSGVLAVLDAAEKQHARTAEVDVAHADFAAAVGFYDCPCGGAFEFGADATLEDYAALNRWLGHHVGRCSL